MTADAESFAPPRKPRREIPYWLIAAALLAVLFFWLIAADNDYRVIFHALRQGILVTLWVTIVAYALAAALGLLVALAMSRFRLIREIDLLCRDRARHSSAVLSLHRLRRRQSLVSEGVGSDRWGSHRSYREFDFTWRDIVA